MSTPRIPTDDIPQKDNLRTIRQVVGAVGDGALTTAELAAATRIQPRQVLYSIQAAKSLGWLTSEPRLAITSSGLALLGTDPGSPSEREYWKRSASQSPQLALIAPDLLSARAPKLEDLADRIRELSGASESVARRRAQTLLSWRRQMLKPQLELPTSATRKASRKKGPKGADDHALLWPEMRISDALARDLLRDNPWWQGSPGKALPPIRRDFVDNLHRRLRYQLAPIVVVRGPRQVGKTTAQLQVIADLLDKGIHPRQILRIQCDELPEITRLSEPVLRLVEWYEATVLKKTLNASAHAGEPTYLFFDEVQNLRDWAIQLKHLVDNATTQVVVTGSSALRIEAGRDSLAGRINTIEVGTLTLHEIASIRFSETIKTALGDGGLDSLALRDFWVHVRETGSAQGTIRDMAFAAFSERGGYPLVHERWNVPWHEVADQLNETVIRRVIQHDLRIGDRGRRRDAALLEELFRLACRYAGQAPTLDTFSREAQRALRANIGTQKVRQYLEFLDRTLLLRLVRPLEIRLKKTRGVPKLCLADHGLRASWLQEIVPLDPRVLGENPHLFDLAGRIAESAVGAYLFTVSGLDLAHFAARPGEPEVDYVITVGTKRIPVEVKYRRKIDPMADTEGLRSFIEHTSYNAPFGILVTQTDEISVTDPRIIEVPLPSLLLLK